MALIAVGLLFSSALFSNDVSMEDKVKAGYLYNFTKFIYWPVSDMATFNLCILGADSFGNLIQPIEKKTALGKPIRLYRHDRGDESLSICHIIFFTRIDDAIMYFQKNATINGILTVGNGEDFILKGGMLSFVIRDNRVKLQINPKAVKKSGLGVSAKLLEVAEIVEVAHE